MNAKSNKVLAKSTTANSAFNSGMWAAAGLGTVILGYASMLSQIAAGKQDDGLGWILVAVGTVFLVLGLASLAYVFAKLIIENGSQANATQPQEAKQEPSDPSAQGS